MNRLTVTETPLGGVKIVERRILGDDRGYFARIFCADELLEAGWTGPVVQINESFTQSRGSLRGIHYQLPPSAEMKLVTCLRGAIVDVAVDIRRDSPTLLRNHAEMLSADNARAMLIPEGCAHGFQTLTDDVVLLYCHSRTYAPSAEAGLNPLDEMLGIDWPLPIADISVRDRERARLAPDFAGVEF